MIDRSDLSPEEQALFEHARAAYSPSPERVGAVRDALALRIGAAAVGAAAAAAASKAAATSTGGATGATVAATTASWTAAHWISATVLAAAVTTGAYIATRDDAPARSASDAKPAASAIASAPVASTAPAATAAAPIAPSIAAPIAPSVEPKPTPAAAAAARSLPRATEIALPRARTEASANPMHPMRKPRGVVAKRAANASSTATVARAETAPLASETTAAVATPVAPSPEAEPEPEVDQAIAPEPVRVDALAQELELLRRARGAIDAQRASESLVLLDRYAAQFPKGALRQEALATRVLALCQEQRVAEAKRVAAQLERVAPRSPHLIRLASSCAFGDGSSKSE